MSDFLKIVEGPAVYLCPYCPQPWPTFEDQASMDAHAKAQHPEEWTLMGRVALRSSTTIIVKK